MCKPRMIREAEVCNRRVGVCEGVYEPAEDTWLALEGLKASRGAHVCIDIGTGTGILAVCMAPRCGYIIALDVDACAVSCARRNLSWLINVDVVQCDGLSCVREPGGQKLLVFNSPYLPPTGEADDTAWSGGAKVISKVLRVLRDWCNWRLVLVAANVSPWDEVERLLTSIGARYRILRRQPEDFFVETILATAEHQCGERKRRYAV